MSRSTGARAETTFGIQGSGFRLKNFDTMDLSDSVGTAAEETNRQALTVRQTHGAHAKTPRIVVLGAEDSPNVTIDNEAGEAVNVYMTGAYTDSDDTGYEGLKKLAIDTSGDGLPDVIVYRASAAPSTPEPTPEHGFGYPPSTEATESSQSTLNWFLNLF
ncbi:MAG: hypothetical protein KC475_12740 [Cyanobacteria bacterium HKST-UBA03]|nr:hypothetical protein [Cyanobacteria bacterium HKST-UBA03]